MSGPEWNRIDLESHNQTLANEMLDRYSARFSKAFGDSFKFPDDIVGFSSSLAHQIGSKIAYLREKVETLSTPQDGMNTVEKEEAARVQIMANQLMEQLAYTVRNMSSSQKVAVDRTPGNNNERMQNVLASNKGARDAVREKQLAVIQQRIEARRANKAAVDAGGRIHAVSLDAAKGKHPRRRRERIRSREKTPKLTIPRRSK